MAFVFSFFFNDTATTEIYTLSLHDALPILEGPGHGDDGNRHAIEAGHRADRKSTRLNSSHQLSSYAVFCLKKKKPLPYDSEFDSFIISVLFIKFQNGKA